jgi:hypothetical protein
MAAKLCRKGVVRAFGRPAKTRNGKKMKSCEIMEAMPNASWSSKPPELNASKDK